MKYFATIDTNKNRIVSVCAIAGGIEILTTVNETISEITKEQYDTVGTKEANYDIENGNLVIGQLYDRTPPTLQPSEVEILQQTVADLESQNTDLMLAIAEMAEATEQSKTETQLAIAELAEIIAGGA